MGRIDGQRHFREAWDLAERLYPDQSVLALRAAFRGKDNRMKKVEGLDDVGLMLLHLVLASEGYGAGDAED